MSQATVTVAAAYAAEVDSIRRYKLLGKKRNKKVNGKNLPALALWLATSYVFRRDKMARHAKKNLLGVNVLCFEF